MCASNLKSQAEWKISTNLSDSSDSKATSNELVMAWAQDKDTHEPRYILELNEHQRGAKCNCVCVSCKLPLIAVNASKTEYQQRPHFRHPAGGGEKFLLCIGCAVCNCSAVTSPRSF